MSYTYNDQTLMQRRRELRRNQTDAEKAFWQQVRGQQFCGLKFFRQYSVGAYIVDFYCPAKRIAVELDGGQHNMPDCKEYDAIRTEFMRGHDIQVVRFWNSDVLGNMQGVLEKLAELVKN
ncbi:MAG: endonuclease domain-containing protein [Trichloromonadaceae bacterium]